MQPIARCFAFFFLPLPHVEYVLATVRVRAYPDDHTLLIYLLAQTGNRPWKHTFPRFRSLPYVLEFRNASPDTWQYVDVPCIFLVPLD